jgi:hypothetical protein
MKTPIPFNLDSLITIPFLLSTSLDEMQARQDSVSGRRATMRASPDWWPVARGFSKSEKSFKLTNHEEI